MTEPSSEDRGPATLERVRLEVIGQVQGVGFRPFIYRCADRFGLAGFVANTADGAVIEVEGPTDSVRRFEVAVCADAPPLAKPEIAVRVALEPEGANGFVIRHSIDAGGASALITPDVCTCPDCLRELQDPSDRRYRYPFINCTNCGPRYTIIEGVPYDRPKTTMKVFPMCPDCRREYEDPLDRRFHAQPNACPECGPHVELWDAGGNVVDRCDPIEETARLLQDGLCVAIKGLGGFHLAVDATNPDAVARLRQRKRRARKPFAIMCPDLSSVTDICVVDETAAQLLESPERPIVLMPRRDGCGIALDVAPDSATWA